ncbi:hypothetical protein I4J89_44050 [Actinoplanes sp. NEAU-A11]|uniref:Transposase n=1 Tax=Actinoplanes aureus TaxID=2792083 RepID=A0A931CP09_9ACTN|nr:hypothetical protein [Actinoplanes aureus]
MNAANRIDWRRAIDGRVSHRREGVQGTGPSPVNRGKPGSKHHLICDGIGTPSTCDCSQPITGRPGRSVVGSTCSSRTRDTTATPSGGLSERGTKPIILKCKTSGVKGPGDKLRYVVEQTFALLHQFRRTAGSPPVTGTVEAGHTFSTSAVPWM